MFNENDLRMAAEIGAELAEEESLEPIDERIVRARMIALGYQATEVLGVLRLIRDQCQAEWDAIMSSPQGPHVCGLWDKLRAEERSILDDEMAFHWEPYWKELGQ